MKQYGKKLTALLLAACLLLGLAACGGSNNGGGKDGADGQSDTVFVPTFTDVKLDVDDIDNMCFAGNYIYIMGRLQHETPVTETDPETGEEYTYYNYQQEYVLYRLNQDGTGVTRLDAYQSPQVSPEGWFYIDRFEAGADGTLYITEYITDVTYDLPEDFDETTDNKYNYAVYTDSTVTKHLDAEGNELERTEGGGEKDQSALAEQLGVEWLSSVCEDSAGNTYAVTEKFIAVLDGDGNELFRVEGTDLYNSLYELADGNMAILVYAWDDETETSSETLKTIDFAAKAWGPEYTLPTNVYELYRGGGDYLFYYRNNDSIYGWKTGAEAGEKLFSWLDADVNSGNVRDFTFLADGRVLALTTTWTDSGDYQAQLVTMTPTPRSEVPEKTTLVYGTMYLDYTTRDRIIQYNKNSTTHRIEVRDYSEYDTGDSGAALTRLNTEMLAGNVPDILATDSMPVRQYAAKGILEDLWPWIEKDPELGRDSLIEAPFNAASIDGKLYYIFDTFMVHTVVGRADAVGDRMSWTVADLQAAMAGMPEGATIFNKYDTKDDMLRTVMSQNIDSFVNWTTGQCSFNTPEFKALLEFCNSFPAEYNYEEDEGAIYESEYARMLKGQQLLMSVGVSSLNWGITELEAAFEGKYSYIGYPKEDGSVGSAFIPYDGVAMSTSCKDKDAAWGFIRDALLPKGEDSGNYSGLPVNKADFDEAAAYAMLEYELDENGDVLLDENGDPVPIYTGSVWLDDQTTIETKPLTREALDKFMALVDSITSIYDNDERIYDIVEGEVGAYFAGDSTLDNVANLIQSKVQLYVGEQM